MARKRQSKPKRGPNARQTYDIGCINDAFKEYYRAQLVPAAMSEEEFEEMISAFSRPLPHVFRVSPIHANSDMIEREASGFVAQLGSAGIEAASYNTFPPNFGSIYRFAIGKQDLRKNPELSAFKEWNQRYFALGGISRQEFVSMIPPYFLDVQPEHRVLDCCASPGSKTTQVLEMMASKDSPLFDGLVVANDFSFKRCCTLTHQLNRLNTTGLVVTNHSAQYFPDLEFDRIVCDVPCSGDGTLRKNYDIAATWAQGKGRGLHPVQRSILLRALELLAPGGMLTYSTCSMNPIEDEAVVNSVLLSLNGAAGLVDCSSTYPELVRSPGLTSWAPPDDADSTMLPSPQIPNLPYCMRFYPHQNDSGAFFVAVIRKISPFPRKSPRNPNPHDEWTSPPYLPLTSPLLDDVIDSYGLTTLPPSSLYCRDQDQVRSIYYFNEPCRRLITTSDKNVMRVVSAGTRVLSWKSFKNESCLSTVPTFDGISIFSHYATKRKVMLPVDEMKILLSHQETSLDTLSPTTQAAFSSLSPGGVILGVIGCPQRYSALFGGRSITLYVKASQLAVERAQLDGLFPE